MVNSRQKGKRGELLWRDQLRHAGWPEARRGQQFSGSSESADVVGGPKGWHCEVKVRERLDPWAAIRQAEHDGGEGNSPYVAWKKNNRPWLVVLRAEDFLRLVGERRLDQEQGGGDAARVAHAADEDRSRVDQVGGDGLVA